MPEEPKEIQKVYYVQKQPKFGDISVPMEVLGLVVVSYPEQKNRGKYTYLCWELKEPDGKIDYWPVTNDYQLITLPEKDTV